ncbi:hypothetical protein N836_00545 [Leptolyngbya sp. Heron Island J]|uniref:hypothetical protein n=1 Tax=Leptolyngbya sp. Heron Island J TaxID=1385935 RepID=UPI0003B9A28B|nr:hypothetical protein [Leptolyngbya sp. Heron Island J]ESA36395.1 hypothetical protein N836_00545 [Leptolyngbya sp. Heron Island J]
MASIFRNLLASVTGLGLALGLAAVPVLAQTNGGFDDLSGESTNNEVFSGSGLSLTDLMNNARRSQGLDSAEFGRQSDQNIDEAAADFRQRQQEALEADQGAAAVETPEFEGQQL